MQYLLTEEEFTNLTKANKWLNERGGLENHKLALENVCKKIATEFAEPGSWTHGCIHVKVRLGDFQCNCCDMCPVAAICPMDKRWSIDF